MPTFSIFTPSHRPDYLTEAYRSLQDQSRADWEWVIVTNGPGAGVPEAITRDPRVRVIPAPETVDRRSIGALKRFACGQCRGEWLVELDHDDWLREDTLARIREAADTSGAGFIYSDFSNVYPDGRCQVYADAYGWSHYDLEYRGKRYTAMRAFGIDAGSLHLIFYAPNHVRAWHREAYAKAGGHDPNLQVADDHDLLCRTYRAGVAFHHIPECLYFYRLQQGDRNTFLERNQEIQHKQQEVSNRHVYGLIQEWCRRSDRPMLDLGGAHDSPAGYQRVSLSEAARRGLPFGDGSVGCIRAHDVLQRIPACRDAHCTHGRDGDAPRCVVGMMNEIYRVLAPGGWLLTATPSTDGRGAFQDPTHGSFWNPNSFWYYTRRDHARFVSGVQCRFQAPRVWQSFPSDWHKQHNILYVYADLVALKGQRQPGICEI